MALAVVAFFLLVLVVPPLISVSHYKGQITRLMAQSLGRPVRLSSVEVRLLPWPGFVLYDLSVAEDPAYGAEPVLHANKVTASLRLLSVVARPARDRQDQRGRGQPEPGARRSRPMEPRSPLPHRRRADRRRCNRPAKRLGRATPARAALCGCLRLRPRTRASTSRTARKSCPSRCSTPTSRSGRRVPASGASACAASRRAPT